MFTYSGFLFTKSWAWQILFNDLPGCTKTQYFYAIWQWDPRLSREWISQVGDFGAPTSSHHKVQVGKTYSLITVSHCNNFLDIFQIRGFRRFLKCCFYFSGAGGLLWVQRMGFNMDLLLFPKMVYPSHYIPRSRY